jgi:hypothetical protein
MSAAAAKFSGFASLPAKNLQLLLHATVCAKHSPKAILALIIPFSSSRPVATETNANE